MQEENLKEVYITIESELSSARVQLYRAEDIIKSALHKLDSAIQTIQNLSMQNDMHVCKSQERLFKEQTCTSGEKQEIKHQLTHDPVKIAEDFWKSFKLEE